MARKAREKDDYGVYYVTQYSSSERELFQNDKDREQFLQILNRAQNKFNFKLYAYCISSVNEYHLIIDVNGGDLSKIMKSINISYAMYASCNGKLFKDRYKSTLLRNKKEKLQIIDDIHKRVSDETIWNSFCSFKGLLSDKEYSIPIPTLANESKTQYDEDCFDCINSYKEAEVKLKEIADFNQISVSELINNKVRRNQLIREFRKQSTLSLKELGTLFGGISESSVCKIINQ